MYSVIVAAFSLAVLWAEIHILSRVIPPNAEDEIPAWKSGVMAAVIVVTTGIITGLAMSLVAGG